MTEEHSEQGDSGLIKIEGELACPDCRTPLKFLGDTLNIMHFGCDCPRRMWPLPKSDELKEAYWGKHEGSL